MLKTHKRTGVCSNISIIYKKIYEHTYARIFTVSLHRIMRQTTTQLRFWWCLTMLTMLLGFMFFCTRVSVILTRTLIKFVKMTHKTTRRTRTDVVVHSPAFGGRGYFISRRSRKLSRIFNSTLGFPGEGPKCEFITNGHGIARNSVVLVGWWQLTARISHGQRNSASTLPPRATPIYMHKGGYRCFVWHPKDHLGKNWGFHEWETMGDLHSQADLYFYSLPVYLSLSDCLSLCLSVVRTDC